MLSTFLAARNLRKRQALVAAANLGQGRSEEVGSTNVRSYEATAAGGGPPPHYDAQPPFQCGTSPPPSYDDTILENFYMQIMGASRSQRSSTSSRRSLRRAMFE